MALEDVLARRGTVGGRRPLIDENAAFKGEEGLEAVGKLLGAEYLAWLPDTCEWKVLEK